MNARRTILYGLGVWVVPFVVAIFIFPLRQAERPLFESIMPVALGAATAFFGYRYLSAAPAKAGDGVRLGVAWLVISVALDLLMFSWGPMKMALADYVKDIGATYLLIPIITTAVAMARGS